MLTSEQGEKLVKIARKTVEDYLTSKRFVLKEFDEFRYKRGVFVSIHTFPDHKLRGCIGYPTPEYFLYEALQRAAIESAFRDPRFFPLKRDELKSVVFEVSVLTQPKLIKVKNPKEYLKKIEIGKDGLIIEHGLFKGLLLPQVPVQFEPPWDVQTFLEHLCMKAGLMTDMWLDEMTRIYKFQAQIFAEKEPNGRVISR